MIKGEKKRNHLKLVYSKQHELDSDPIQLSFGFDDPNCIYMISLENKSSYLEHAIKKIKPDHIVDLRKIPRMDSFFGSRRRAFSIFHSFQCEYLDFWGVQKEETEKFMKNKNYWRKQFDALLPPPKKVEKLVIFFDSKVTENFAKNEFVDYFQKKGNKKYSFRFLNSFHEEAI